MPTIPRKHADPKSGNRSTAIQLNATTARLLEAAGRAFNTHGYFGTDTNRIARDAGFAPQTFYRHFTDKRSIFIAVYHDWQVREAKALDAAVSMPNEGAAEAAARVLMRFHKEWAGFRRSLRWLAVVDDSVRAARSIGRERQLERLRRLPGNHDKSAALLFAQLLTVERLCDAWADREFGDADVADAEAAACIREAISAARGD
jgi:AcrR family transcriptional regulator